MKIYLKQIAEIAKVRPPGYYEEVISKGIVEGEMLEIDATDYSEFFKKYRGAGDVVAALAKPLAKAIGLEDCLGCAQRQETLNKLLPFS